MMKDIKTPLVKIAAGILCMVLANLFKSLVLLGASLVLIWFGVSGLINFKNKG